jgi:DNA methylase/ParB-like nuclease family protein
MHRLSIEYLAISRLKLRTSNPRTHSDKQIEQIARSIQRFGFTNAIIADDEGNLVAGEGRLKAAKRLGFSEVPVVRLADMTEAEIRAYVIADNKLAENAGWDRNLLALELQYLSDLGLNDLDVTITGFELPEIEVLMSELTGADSEGSADEVIEPTPGPAITRVGNVWRVGDHRLVCGDSTKPETYQALLADKRAQMVFSDPPYNVPISGHVGGLGKIQHREFAMASGEMSNVEFTAFLTSVFSQLATHSESGAIHFQCIDWRHIGEMLEAGQVAYTELKNICVWSKANAGMGSFYRSQHEFVCVFKSGDAPHINNIELGKFGRYRTNIWAYPGVNGFGHVRSDLELHPTVKPVALVEDAIRDCSRRKGIVLDPFSGSGTTLMAAERTGRRGFGIELDPLYCDVSLRRLRSVCGLQAILETTGQKFEQLAAQQQEEVALAEA